MHLRKTSFILFFFFCDGRFKHDLKSGGHKGFGAAGLHRWTGSSQP